MADPKKCAHSNCSCIVEKGKYCSQVCEDAADIQTLACDCPHPGCTGHAV